MNQRNKNGAGKGDTPRPVDRKKYDENWIKIFGDRGCTLNHKHEKDCEDERNSIHKRQ